MASDSLSFRTPVNGVFDYKGCCCDGFSYDFALVHELQRQGVVNPANMVRDVALRAFASVERSCNIRSVLTKPIVVFGLGLITLLGGLWMMTAVSVVLLVIGFIAEVVGGAAMTATALDFVMDGKLSTISKAFADVAAEAARCRIGTEK